MAILIDWSLPPEMDFAEVVRALVREISGQCDVIAFRTRVDLPNVPDLQIVKPYHYAGHKGYLIPKDRSQQCWENCILMSRADAV